MFVDYDNLHSVLTSQSSTNHQTSDYILEILDEVRRYLEEGDDTPTIFGRAYGAYDTRLKAEDDEIPTTLYRSGFVPQYVSAETQRNASEIQLTIDTTQFLTERQDVGTVVIVTGNRPYRPLARHLREQGHRVLIAAVNPPQAKDTPSTVEDDLYLDARNLLSQESREDLLANAPQNGQASDRQNVGSMPPPRRYQRLSNSMARRTIDITDEHFGQYEEVYLTPLLRKLSEVLGSEHDPKALVSELEAAGAARLEKREGHPYDYTVLILNDDHPDVRDIQSGGRTEAVSVDATPSPTEEAPAPSFESDTADEEEEEAPPTADEVSDDESEESEAETGDPAEHDEFLMDDALSSAPPSSEPDDPPSSPDNESNDPDAPDESPASETR